MDADNDEALMARIGRGDRAAFQTLAHRHAANTVALATRILGNRADAEDVAQDALLRVWTNAPRWQPLARFRTWLTRIVVNLCLDRQRRARWVAIEAAGELVDPSHGPAVQHELDERDRLLAEAIGRLPARQRTAIVLIYREGMSHAETAEILDTTVSAVETLVARGKTALRRALKESDGD
jgi:RNA polymerase sigma-70 factor (ECF subfamily)